MLTDNLDVKLIEVNLAPSLGVSSTTDYHLKQVFSFILSLSLTWSQCCMIFLILSFPTKKTVDAVRNLLHSVQSLAQMTITEKLGEYIVSVKFSFWDARSGITNSYSHSMKKVKLYRINSSKTKYSLTSLSIYSDLKSNMKRIIQMIEEQDYHDSISLRNGPEDL